MSTLDPRRLLSRSAPVVTARPASGLRAQMIAWARETSGRGDVVFLDTETTGLDHDAEIIEIAVLDARGATLLDTLVRPDRPIPADASRIHGIDDALVAGAPRWPEVAPLLIPLLLGRRVIVYNADFDARLVNQMNARHGVAFHPGTAGWHCAMKRYADFVGEPNPKYGGNRWHRLDVAVAAFGAQPGGHRARADAEACRLVVAGMARAR